MATALRNLINGVSSSTELTPYVYNGSSWVITHTNVHNGSGWIQIPNWVADTVPYPKSAMTSNSAPSPYIASASSEYSSTYGAWRAFNKDYSNATSWASTNNPGSAPWIRFKFNTPLKNIYIQLYNRTRTSLVNGIISATIQGSDDGATWTNIGTISGRAGSTSAYGSTHYCNNYDNTYTWIRLLISDWDRRTQSSDNYVTVGELYVYGKVAS